MTSVSEWCRDYGIKKGWPVLLGLAILYVPTFYDLSHGLWNNKEQGHGPFILAVTVYLFWQKRHLFIATTGTSHLWAGSLVLLSGLLFYAVGRSQDILIFEIGSIMLVLGGSLLITVGIDAVKQTLFPLLFIVFMIPMPGFLVDEITGPLKQLISSIAEQILYWAGYPIARLGVSLLIGKYQLLVVDACSGLHSLFSLLAVGLLYQHLRAYKNWKHRLFLLLSIIPVAFFANVVRVILLVLITYHLGDKAGQGILHNAAGIIMFTAAMLVFFTLDSLLRKVFPEPVFVPSNLTANI
ncbi:exosortase B [Methylobacter sp.]|uniref:exosortase B n=1 Tax=Methylobacter sp. TaxID=2051955 RepID=UPI002FDE7984